MSIRRQTSTQNRAQRKARQERVNYKPFWERYGKDIQQSVFFIFSFILIFYLLTPPGGWLRLVRRWREGRRKRSLTRKPKAFVRERKEGDRENFGYQYRDDNEFVVDKD